MKFCGAHHYSIMPNLVNGFIRGFPTDPTMVNGSIFREDVTRVLTIQMGSIGQLTGNKKHIITGENGSTLLPMRMEAHYYQ